MMDQILFFLHYGLLMIFGVLLSAAFAGVRLNRNNTGRLLALLMLCGSAQLAVFLLAGEGSVWQLYPLLTHVPTVAVLCVGFGKRLSSAFTATATAYLCCQPANWFGMLVQALSGSWQAEMVARMVVLMLTGNVLIRRYAHRLAELYNQDMHGAWVFGIIPVVYYLFDYFVSIYTSLWLNNNQLVAEFLPLFLCVGHVALCAVYYREYRHKQEAEEKEQLLRLVVSQQSREVETIRRSETELRQLRHDLKLLLGSLSASVEAGDKEAAGILIEGFSHRVEKSVFTRYCSCDTLNYVLSDYAARCREQDVTFAPAVALTGGVKDEMLFSIILANALDNAIYAQRELPREQREIRMVLKTSGGKTLLSVKNPYHTQPKFVDGMPVATREGHGYGTRSIRYAAESLGGNCRFTLEEGRFVLRVVV